MMVRPCFSSETQLSTLSVLSRSADGSKRLDNNSNFGDEYYAVGKKTCIALRLSGLYDQILLKFKQEN